MPDTPFSNVAFLQNCIEQMKEFVRLDEVEMLEHPERHYGMEPAYMTHRRHLKELQEKLIEAKQEELLAVG